MSDPDDLFTLRNFFWLGSYQQAIAEASGLGRLPDALKLERDEFIYRSYVALGQGSVVMNEVKDDAPVSLQAIKLLAQYLTQPMDKEMIVLTLAEWLDAPVGSGNPTLQLIAATIYMHEDNVKEALKAVCNSVTMEQLSMSAQIYLKMNRVDLATNQLRMMQQADEDATLTQLVTAWVNLHKGGKAYQEAAYIFSELMDKFQASPMLLNGAAVANMHLGDKTNLDEAEAQLVEALGKSQSDPDTLINLIACYRLLDKPSSFIDRYVAQLKAAKPDHPYVSSLATAETAFERVAATFAV